MLLVSVSQGFKKIEKKLIKVPKILLFKAYYLLKTKIYTARIITSQKVSFKTFSTKRLLSIVRSPPSPSPSYTSTSMYVYVCTWMSTSYQKYEKKMYL